MRRLAMTICAMTLLPACHHSADVDATDASAPQTHAGAKRGPSREEQTRGMVEAASLGSSQLPVSVKFDVTSRPEVGRTVELSLAVLPGIAASSASLRIEVSDGLKLATAPELDLPNLESGQVYHESIGVTPTAEGVHLVSVAVMLHHDDANETRTFSVPVIVDTAPADTSKN